MNAVAIREDQSILTDRLDLARKRGDRAIHAAAEVARAAKAVSGDPKVMGVNHMRDGILAVLDELMGDAETISEAQARGFRTRILDIAFRPEEYVGRQRQSQFRASVRAALMGEGGKITCLSREQTNGEWVPCGYAITETFDVCREPSRPRTGEGDNPVEMPDEGGKTRDGTPVGLVNAVTDRLEISVRVVDLKGAEDLVYAKDGSGKMIDAPQVNVQLTPAPVAAGGNDAVVAQLMAQLAAMQAQMAAMQAATVKPADTSRAPEGVKPAESEPGKPAESEPAREHWRTREARLAREQAEAEAKKQQG